MKKIALVLAAVIPFAAAGQELATYTISTSIDGMAVDGMPPGVGNREVAFTLYIDPTDADAANELFYRHLEVILGPDQLAAFRANARQMTRGLR